MYQLIIRNRVNRDEKVIYETNNIENMDNYTRGYVGYNDLLHDNGIDYRNNDIYLVCKNRFGIKYLDILFVNDVFDNENIKYMYFSLLKDKRYMIEKSNIRYVNIGIDINRDIDDFSLYNVISAYLKGYPYYKVRDIYMVLLEQGIIKRYIDNDIIDRGYVGDRLDVNDDEYLESLIHRDDYEEIFNYYGLDDLSSKDIEYVIGCARVRRR